jgi:bacillithiol biosynthesis cysteine-adding enzyme BshC
VATCFSHIPYSDTGYFSKLITDYLSDSPALKPFYTYAPTHEGIDAAIAERSNYPVNRTLLTTVLNRQYAELHKHEKVAQNLQLLQEENTYTICTAHQPNLMTGYLYFVYKIIHAIKLAEELKAAHPDNNFVPVYYMGSEDNDLEELGTFRYNGDKYVWDGDGQTGAVGRMDTKSLRPILNVLFKLLGPPGTNSDDLKAMLSEAYLSHNTIADATQYLVNKLFGHFGLIIINPDDTDLKRAFIPVMRDDLLHQHAFGLVTDQVEQLEQVNYKSQAHPRAINLFYLKDNVRERIEKKGTEWIVINTDIKWDEAALIAELDTYPDRFSPNVILRGLYQETLLPDIAFIGGGSEVAYWMELKKVFGYYHVFYPAILLRQSVLWLTPAQVKMRRQLDLSISNIFKPEGTLIKEFLLKNSSDDWQTHEEAIAIENVLAHVKQKAVLLDTTLRAAAEAVLVKIKYQLQVLEKKMLRAEKKKMQVHLAKISKMKDNIFPNDGLQERVENFSGYFLQYGYPYFDTLKDAMMPFNNQFLVLEDMGNQEV